MRKLFIMAIVLVSCSVPEAVKAQDHQMAVSIRGGESSGICLHYFQDETRAIEGMISYRNNGMQLTVIRDYYRPVFWKRNDHLFFYYGWGGHLGFDWPASHHYVWDYQPQIFASGPAAGIDLLGGIEYRFYKVPVSLGVDFKPFAELSATRLFSINLIDFGFRVKYSFNLKH